MFLRYCHLGCNYQRIFPSPFSGIQDIQNGFVHLCEFIASYPLIEILPHIYFRHFL